MKKSLLLGAAAMAAAVVAAPQAEAADVKVGGYYMIRFQDHDLTIDRAADNATGVGSERWVHRAQINVAAKVSDKTSAHVQARFVDDVLDGQAYNTSSANGSGNSVDIMRAWMETEMYGVGIKAGSIPINMHDKLLFKDSGGSIDALMLSKSFGGVTVLLGDILAEDNTSGTEDAATNIYLASVMGKAASVNWQVTYAHQMTGDNPVIGGYQRDTDNDWVAATIGTEMAGIKMSLTGIWEAGLDDYTNSNKQLEDEGGYGALKISGKTGFGGWNAYGFYASEDYSHPLYQDGGTPRSGHAPGFSTAWDQGGAGGTDLLQDFWVDNGTGTTGNGNASQMENVWGVGVGLTVKAGSWTIKPQVDYAALVEDNVTGGNGTASSDAVWAGSLTATTKLDEGTTFSVIAIGASPEENGVQATGEVTDIRSLQAEFKVKF